MDLIKYAKADFLVRCRVVANRQMQKLAATWITPDKKIGAGPTIPPGAKPYRSGTYGSAARYAQNIRDATFAAAGVAPPAAQAAQTAAGAGRGFVRSALGATGRGAWWLGKKALRYGFSTPAVIGYDTIGAINDWTKFHGNKNPMLTGDGHAKSTTAQWIRTAGRFAWLPIMLTLAATGVGAPVALGLGLAGNYLANKGVDAAATSVQNRADKNYARAMQKMYSAGLDPTKPFMHGRSYSYD